MRSAVCSMWLVAVALACTAALAQAAWTEPIELGDGDRAGGLVQVAVNARGDAAFAWTRRGVVRAQARSHDGTLGPVRTLSAAGERGQGVRIGIDRDGDAVVVWARYDTRRERVRARLLRASGATGPALTLSPGFAPGWLDDLAVSPSGRAIVTWSQQGVPRGGIYAAAIRPDGSKGRVVVVSGRRELTTSSSTVAINARGQAVYAWTGHHRGRSSQQVRARMQTAAGRLGPIVTLSGPRDVAPASAAAIDARGRALVAWQVEYTIGRLRGPNGALRARALSPRGRPGPTAALSGARENVEEDFVLAMRPAGGALVVWSSPGRGLAVRPVSPGGRPDERQRLQGPGVHTPSVGVSADGAAVVAWLDVTRLRHRVVARTRSAAGELGDPVIVSDPRQQAEGAAVGVDSQGRAVAAWRLGATPQAAAGP